jgi:hypothetical protein
MASTAISSSSRAVVGPASSERREDLGAVMMDALPARGPPETGVPTGSRFVKPRPPVNEGGDGDQWNRTPGRIVAASWVKSEGC